METQDSAYLATQVILDPITMLNLEIAQEGLRQSRGSFNLARKSLTLAFVMTTASGMISLVGASLLFTNKAPEGTITTAIGLVSSLGFSQLAKDAREQLEEANIRLDSIRAEFSEGYFS